MAMRPRQIHIITEEIVILFAVSRAYKDKPVTVITADSADLALTQMATSSFDLFLLDLDIKDGSSFYLLEMMTERSPEVPVILMTTRDVTSPSLLEKIRGSRPKGCWQLLEKPFDYRKLLSFIERGLAEYKACTRGSHLCIAHDATEKRRCRRFPQMGQVTIYLPETKEEPDGGSLLPLNVNMTDLSVGGIGLSSRKKLSEHQPIQFDENFNNQPGIVAWCRPETQGFRIGVRFL